MGFVIEIRENAKKGLPKLKAVNLHYKFDQLVTIIKESPLQTPSSYGKLANLLYYSRRLSIQHRLSLQCKYEKQKSSNRVCLESL